MCNTGGPAAGRPSLSCAARLLYFVASYCWPLSIGVAPFPWSCGTPTLTVLLMPVLLPLYFNPYWNCMFVPSFRLMLKR